MGIALLLERPGRGILAGKLLGGLAGQAVEGEVSRRIAELALGAQHKHGQALERGGQQAAVTDQHDFISAAPEADEAGQHAALGRAKSREAGLIELEQREIVAQLAMEKAGCVGANGADDTKVGNGGNAVQGQRLGLGHG
jgi:hypothetical protein